MKTKLFAVAVFVMILCCMTAVSAAEDNMTEIALEETSDDFVVESSVDDVDIVADDGDGENEKIDAEINLTPHDDMKAGVECEITVNAPADATNWIDVYYDDYYYCNHLMLEETRSCTFTPKDLGSHSLKLHYYGDDKYNEKDYIIPFEVNDYEINLKCYDDVIDWSSDENYQLCYFYLSRPSSFDGDVDVTINGKKYTFTKESGYSYGVNVTDLKVGFNDVKIYFEGDGKFHEFTKDSSVEMINRSSLSMDVTVPDTVKANENTIITVTLSENIDGDLQLVYDDEYYYIQITEGSGSFEIYLYSMDEKKYKISFLGNDEYKPVSQIISVTPNDYTLDVFYYYDENMLDVWAPYGFDGDVNVTVGTEKYVATHDNYEFNLNKKLDYGEHVVNLYYKGDSIFHEINVDKTIFVRPDIKFSVPYDDDYWYFRCDLGSDVYFSLDLPDDARGKLVAKVYDDEDRESLLKTLESDGELKISLSNLDLGRYYVAVEYVGEDYSIDSHSWNVLIKPVINHPNYILRGDTGYIYMTGPGDNLTLYLAFSEGEGYYEYTKIGFVEFKDNEAGFEVSGDIDKNNHYSITYQKGEFSCSDEIYISILDITVDVADKSISKSVSSFNLDCNSYLDLEVEYYLDGVFKSKIVFDDYDEKDIEDIEFGETLTLGEHIIKLKFDNGAEREFKFNVVPEYNLNVPEYVLKGSNTNVTFTIDDSFGGNVTAYDENGNEFGFANVVGGVANISLAGLESSQLIKLNYTSDAFNTTFEKYINIIAITFSIENNSDVTSDLDHVYVYFSVHDYDANAIILVDGDEKINYGYVVNSYGVQLDLTVGPHTIEARFIKDDYYLSSKISFKVLPECTVTAPKYILKGSDANVTFRLDDLSFGGNVTAYDENGNEFGFANVVGGVANISLAGLESSQFIKLNYTSDAFNTTFEKYINIFAITFSIENNSDVNVDRDNVYVYFSFYDSDANVVILVDDSLKINGHMQYSYSVPLELTAGPHTVEVRFIMDDYSTSAKINFNALNIVIDIPDVIAKNYNDQSISQYISITPKSEMTGTAKIMVDEEEFTTVNINGYSYSYLSNLDVGYHDVEVIYTDGSDDALSTSKSKRVYVDYVACLEGNVADYKIGDIKAYVPSYDSYSVKIDGKDADFTSDYSNHLVIDTANLEIGRYNIVIEGVKDDESSVLINNAFEVKGIIRSDQVDTISLVLPENASGKLVVEVTKWDSELSQYVNIETSEVPLSCGKAEFVNELLPDSYLFIAHYEGDDYDVSMDYFDFNSMFVAKLDKFKMYVNETATVTFKTAENTGNLSVSIYGVLSKQLVEPVVDNRAAITISDLPAGKYGIEIYHIKDEFSSVYINYFELEVLKYDTGLNVEFEDISEGETAYVNVTLPDDAAGTVTVFVDGKKAVGVDAAASLSIPIKDLTVGAHVIEVRYSDDDKYMDNSTVSAIVVKKVKINPVITAEPVEITEGQSANIEISIDSDATGVILVEIGGEKYYGEISEGKASVEVKNLKADEYNAVISYAGDEKYNQSSSEVSVKVNEKADSIISIADVELNIGESAVFTATVNGANADLTFTINGAETGRIADVKATTYTVTASFAGNATHKQNSTSKVFTVEKSASEVAIGEIGSHNVGDEFTIGITNTTAAVVTINGKQVPVRNGKVTVKDLPAGEYTITASIAENDKFLANSANKTFTISKATPQISINAETVIVGEDAEVEITVGDATGVVVLTYGENKYYGELEDGKTTLTLPEVMKNTTLTIKYLGDDKYAENTKSGEIKVSKIDFEMSLEEGSTYVGNSGIYVELPDGATGNITAYIGDNKVAETEADGGYNYLEILDLAVGEYDIKVKYSGDDRYNSQNGSIKLAVEKDEPYVSVSADDTKVGENTTIFIDVSYGMDKIKVTLDGTPIEGVELDEYAQAYINKQMLTGGNHTVVVTFDGNDRFTNASANVTFFVEPVDIEPEITVPENIAAGEKATVKVEVPKDAKGNVTVSVDGVKVADVPVKDGIAEIPVELTKGKHYVDVAYTGDETYNPASKTINVDVAAKESDISIKTPEAKVGDDTSVDVNIPGATGDVAVIVDGIKTVVALKDGNASVPVKNVSAGNHSVVVVYNGDETHDSAYSASSFEVPEVVVPPKEAANLSVVVSDVKVGESGVVSVSVVNGTGDVTVIVDGKESVVALTGGNASVPVNNVSAGNHSVVVIYSGDDNHNGTFKAVTFEVPEEVVPEKVDSVASVDIPDDVKTGNAGNIAVGVENATGNVTVIVDGKETTVPLKDGKVNVPVGELAAGNHSVVVIYSGDDNHNGTFKAVTFEVPEEVVPEKVDSVASVDIPDDVKTGNAGNIAVGVENATGNVTVIVDGKETTVPLKDGKANIPVGELSSGDHSVVVIYSSDETHAPVYKASSFSIEEKPVVKPLASEIADMVITKDLEITAVLKDENGNPIKDANVTYTVNGKKQTVTTDDKGSFTITGVNDAVIAIDYAGDENILPVNTSITISQPKAVERLSTMFNVKSGYSFEVYAVDYGAGERGYKFNVVLSDSNKKPLAKQLVQFGIQGVVHNKTTNNKGIATLQINLMAANEYTCTPCYLGNTTYDATFSATKIIVVKKPVTIQAKAKTFKASVKTKKYTVTLKTIVGSSADGKIYFSAGKKVTMKINGKTYSAKTNANGQATFKITKLTKKGKHNAVITFAGDKTYGATTQKVKITIK